MAAPELCSLYRLLLRELPLQPRTTRTAHQKLSSPTPLQRRIRTHIATAPSSQTQNVSSQMQSQIAQAEQLAQYLAAQRSYLALIERYNPGMGMSEEERVRLTARRVGMDLPVEFEGGGGGKE